jgi:hypothetical protein
MRREWSKKAARFGQRDAGSKIAKTATSCDL